MNQPKIIYTMDHLHLQTGDSVEPNLTVDEGSRVDGKGKLALVYLEEVWEEVCFYFLISILHQ